MDMDWGVVFNNIENQPSDVLPGASITYKKNCYESKVKEDFRLRYKKKKKFSGVSAGVYASENGAVRYYSEDYYRGDKCTKDEEWFTS